VPASPVCGINRRRKYGAAREKIDAASGGLAFLAKKNASYSERRLVCGTIRQLATEKPRREEEEAKRWPLAVASAAAIWGVAILLKKKHSAAFLFVVKCGLIFAALQKAYREAWPGFCMQWTA